MRTAELSENGRRTAERSSSAARGRLLRCRRERSCYLGLSSAIAAVILSACTPAPRDAIEPPQVLTDSVPFVYPLDLWDNNVSGQTVLLLRVSATGQVDSVVVDASSGYPEFDSAAVQGAPRLRFIAARQGERRIPMWTKVPVRFSRDTTSKMGIGGS